MPPAISKPGGEIVRLLQRYFARVEGEAMLIKREYPAVLSLLRQIRKTGTGGAHRQPLQLGRRRLEAIGRLVREKFRRLPGQLPGLFFQVSAMTASGGANLPPALFMAGTDTGVGKTLVTACLLAFFHARGINAGYQKWVSTGSSEASEDEAFCRKRAPKAFLADSALHVPCRFSLAASPHLAAEVDHAAVDTEYIGKSFADLQQHFPLLVVEGVGGLLVPLSRRLLLADFLRAMRLPTILVCRSGLGTINHTLLSIEALRAQGYSPCRSGLQR